ncbi:TPA: 2-C-methyl-D-erythritol 4-phosphate cytidylyltransferase [Streptococcus suis]|uniref:2-C-methyl-D-erythritol 4-phosphate cytidylyltransferase n=1 Tax=Streptococcus suis TaxID=1307 RepID=UPI00161A2A67|nr:2-C-methyl-D-erythritol 4-phosphate cytidylyltransferase [Streptococcus suis]BCK45826.1 2-C-methyl-D-erythritol 4-phosphate cytidylyltransferase [Streptococcus suis]HEM4529273.1 2-C-methyl-D-erythritol 4-phosphate cytidylyltransferase [Streptococcus suis]HEM4575259.1 2-C-methyl-D-erythritol 4-phosphate cytidylyltransferase [Streptococcus suis]HEM4925915.1 2-C-methyl-D-erythritol 4-phosphate cytidylyltransferase [Streptococcus suis]HEM6530676.1 2-C-methyl-D-erythritol 4-phosphate cytidylyltr
MVVSAVIFAGGSGSRMKTTTKPKQFLELHGKPIIIHTIEHFENHPLVDQIVIVCIEGWIEYLETLLSKFQIKKVVKVVPGGTTGQMSIFNGLEALSGNIENDDIVLIHDGVRPLIDAEIITNNIECVRNNRTAITVKPVIETVIQVNEDNAITNVVDRDSCQTAVAPQSFYLADIYPIHLKAQEDGLINMTDSATLVRHYGLDLFTVMGGPENIKITTPSDFYIFRAIYDSRENAQIFG